MTSVVLTPGTRSVTLMGERSQLTELMTRASYVAQFKAGQSSGGKTRQAQARAKSDVRDRLIHNADVSRLTPKEMRTDPAISAAHKAATGHDTPSLATISRVLRKPRP
jgi:hypothetical protein